MHSVELCTYIYIYRERVSVHGVMGKVLNCRPEVNEFKLQSCCYVHFWPNALCKSMNSLLPQL